MALTDEQKAAWLKLQQVWATTDLNVRETIEGEVGMTAVHHRNRVADLKEKGLREGAGGTTGTSVDFYSQMSRAYEAVLNLLDKLDAT